MVDTESYIKIMPADDMAYVRFRRGEVAKTLERGENILVDVDADGRALAVEVIGVSSTPVENILAVLHEFGLTITRQEKQILALAAA